MDQATYDQPFNRLPALPPGASIETLAVMRCCVRAAREIGALDQATKRMPNPHELGRLLPLLEAQQSSAVENIVTTVDKILVASLAPPEHVDAATKEALNYYLALNEALATLDQAPLSVRQAVQICSRIKGHSMAIRTGSRTGLTNDKTGELVYTPPVGETVLRDLMQNWAEYMHADDEVSLLIKMAVGHYQFEAIHPFTDGNGRTGRILNVLYLIEQKALSLPSLYLSKYILANKLQYYKLLSRVTRYQEWEPWVIFILQGIIEVAQWTCERIERFTRERARIKVMLKEQTSFYSPELLDAIFFSPIFGIDDLTDKGVGHYQTCAKYLRVLSQLGIVSEMQSGRRKSYINVRLLQSFVSET